jgi:hypothetical protein
MRLSLALALAVTAVPAFAGPASDAVQFFYSNIGAEYDAANRGRFVDPAKSVLDANEKSEEPCLDFGLALDAQDYDDAEVAKTLKLAEDLNGDSAMVTASFSLFPGDPQNDREIVWELKQVGGQWKVSDIGQANGAWRLSEFTCQ